MSRPVVLVVDPEMRVTCQMADDLRARYRGIHVLTASSEDRGFEIALRLLNDQRRLALLIADAGYGGLLHGVAALHPEANRAALGGDGIGPDGLDGVIPKPWEPCAEVLYPMLNELLEGQPARRDN
jgi:hypothetical protein